MNYLSLLKDPRFRPWLKHQLELHWADVFSHEEKNPIFLVASFRSGSNLLIQYLNQLHGVHFLEPDAELMRRGTNFCYYSLLREFPSKNTFIRHLRRTVRWMKAKNPGFKLPVGAMIRLGIPYKDILKQHPHSKWIILYRESLLDQYCSFQKALITNQYSLRDGDNKNADLQLTVDVEDFKKYCQEHIDYYHQILTDDNICHNAALLSYEEFIRDANGCMRKKIAPHLNLSWEKEYQPMLKKQQVSSLANSIVNYSEVLQEVPENLRMLWLSNS